MPRSYTPKTSEAGKSKRGRKAATVGEVMEKAISSPMLPYEPLEEAPKEAAAQMISEGRYTFGEIAEKVRVDRKTIFAWRNDPVFAARVKEISREFSEQFKSLGICRKEYRIGTLANLQSKLLTVFEERGADSAMQEIAGGKTGLIVQTWKMGKDDCRPEYAVDTGAIRELRGIQEQAAKELGQLVEKRETKLSLKEVDDEQLAELIADLASESDSHPAIEG